MKFILFVSLIFCSFFVKAGNVEYSVTSPGSKIMVNVGLLGGMPYYTISKVIHFQKRIWLLNPGHPLQLNRMVDM